MTTKLKLMLLLIASGLVIVSLTACSTTQAVDKPKFVPDQVQEAKPARPAPLQLYNEPWKRCGKNVCLTASEAKRALDNKVQIYNWMQSANALFCYYEVREGRNVCQFSGASPSQ